MTRIRLLSGSAPLFAGILLAAPLTGPQRHPVAEATPGSPGLSSSEERQDVLLFEHASHDPNFPGWVHRARPGASNHETGFEDDAVSAVLVPPGFRVRLHDAMLPVKDPLELGPGMHDLEEHGFNDRVSSLEVVPPRPCEVGLIEPQPHAGPHRPPRSLPLYHGTVTRWTPAALRPRGLPILQVPQGFEAVFLPPKGQDGPAYRVGPGEHPLPPREHEAAVGEIVFLPRDP